MNKNVMLIGILAVIALIYFLTTRDPSSMDFDKNFTNLNTDNITKIEITKDSTITLTKENNIWVVDNYKANQDLVAKALEDVKNIKLARRVSTTSENHAKYEVDKGLKIVLSGDEQTSFILGKTSASYQNVFIRKPDEDEVYTTVKNFKSNFDKTITDWKDKSILSVSKEAIASISINDNIFITNLDSIAMVKGPKKNQTEKEGNSVAKSMFSKFTALRTLSFPSIDVSNEKAFLTLKVNQAAGDVTTLKLYKNPDDDKKYYLSVEGNPTLFEVYASTFDSFKKGYKELVK